MKLTKAQRRNLKLYASYRDSPPTFWQLFRPNLSRYLVTAALIVFLYALAPTAGTQALTLIATGLFLGVLLRDIRAFLHFERVWPATAAVLDWQRLEVLLSEPDATSPEASAD